MVSLVSYDAIGLSDFLSQFEQFRLFRVLFGVELEDIAGDELGFVLHAVLSHHSFQLSIVVLLGTRRVSLVRLVSSIFERPVRKTGCSTDLLLRIGVVLKVFLQDSIVQLPENGGRLV